MRVVGMQEFSATLLMLKSLEVPELKVRTCIFL
jgi:hypothetical protein